jgi:hypothetical protein
VISTINYYDSAKDYNFHLQRDNLPQPASPIASIRSNYSVSSLVNATLQDQIYLYVIPAIQGFFTCIKLSSAVSSSLNQEANCLQNTLRLLTLWFGYCNNAEIYDVLYEGFRHTPTEI